MMSYHNFKRKIFNLFKNRAFDKKYGIETTQDVPLTNLQIIDQSKKHGRKYQGTHCGVFNRIFKLLSADYRQYTFVDIGSGKGRALIMASELGFKKVIGVDFSMELCHKAQINLNKFIQYVNKHQSFTSQFTKAHEIYCLDASKFIPPLDSCPIVFYLFNPFDHVMIDKFLNNIENYRTVNVKNDFFVYVNPLRASIFRKRNYRLIMSLDAKNHNDKVHIYQKDEMTY